MHILHLTIPFEYSCGITRHVWSLAREQRRQHRVTVMSSGGGATELLKAAGVTWLRLPVDPASKHPWHAIRAVHTLRRYIIAEHVSVVHAHHRYHALLGKAAAWMSGRTPIVATCHYTDRLSRVLSFPGMPIIAVSEATRRILTEQLHIAESRVTMISHCLPPPLPITDPLDPRVARLSSRPVVVAAGRLSPEKGFEVFVRAMAAIAGHATRPYGVIVGDGPMRAPLESLAIELGAPIVFTGAVRGVYPYFERAAVVVQPSLNETASLSVLEAGACSRAVVATTVGGLPEIIDDGETGLLVPPADPSALALAIRRLLEDESLRLRLGASLHAAIASRLNPVTMAEAVDRVYAAAGAHA